MQKGILTIPSPNDGKWGSYISKYPADSGKVQPNMWSVGSRNGVTSITGQADKRPGGAIWNANSLLSGAPLDQYEGIFLSGVRLLIVNDAGTLKASTGNGTFANLVGGTGFTNPSNFEFATYQNRVYGCNGVDQPVVVDTVTSYGGVSYGATPGKIKTMGAQAPGSAPTATRNTDSTTNQVPAGSHTYKITFVYYSGVEESNGGAASSVCVNDATHTSNALTAIPVGGYGVTARNIYRDNNDGAWLLLDTISNNTATTYTDTKTAGSTPTPIPTDNGLPPVFKYIALYLDRLFVIDVTGKNIYWSNAGQPDVFSAANSIAGPQDDVMTAIYIYNGIPWVFGQHTVGVILGTTDSSFFYSPISTSVGCVDNRSIQTRTIVSTPTLLWLAATPNKGIYYTNGSTVQYLSDFIEDLTFNLAQISYLQRQNTQNSQAAFQGGTASESIDLLTNPGTVQTINPVSRYSHAADWAAGVLSNIAVSGDQLMVPVGTAFVLASGSLTGVAQISGGNITLPGGGNFTGESHSSAGVLNYSSDIVNTRYFSYAVAQSFVPSQTGTLNNLTGLAMKWKWLSHSGNQNCTVSICANSGGVPGGTLATTTFSSASGNGADQSISFPSPITFNVALTGGTTYWIVVTVNSISNDGQICEISYTNDSWTSGGSMLDYNGSTWSTWGPPVNTTPRRMAATYTYTITPVSESGTWTSAVYDSLCTTQTSGMSLAVVATYDSPSTSSIAVQGSANQSSWTTTDTLSSPNGTVSLTGGQYRYWRLVVTVSTSDSRHVPLVGAPTLTFNTTGTWTSATINCTADITALSALLASTFVPSGTTATITIATSTDNISYSSYTALGSAVAHKYAKIRVTMTTTSDNMTSPTLLTAELDWAVTGTLASSIIDTGSVPSGWGIFQYAQVGTAGTIQAAFRTASTSGGIPAAIYSNVPNGGFPTNTVFEFCQWKLTMSSTVDNIPQVNSVTVNWLLSSGANIRAASLFFNKSYYLAVATQGSTTNNTLIELDQEGNWRVHSGNNIATMGTYFNDAFNGDALSGKILNMFKLPTDNGTNITMDVRTKAFGPGDDEHLTVARSLRVVGVNTGTTVHAYYSTDMGTTWIEMLNSSGVTGYATTADLSTFDELFIPKFDGSVKTSGRTIIFRIVSDDASSCSIRRIKPTWYVRKGKMVSEVLS